MSSGIFSLSVTEIPKRESEGMERISTKRVVVKRGEKLALPKADISMEVPGTPKELLYVYDQKMLRTVGDEFQLDVAPQAVTLTGNADLGEWKADPGRCLLLNGRPFGIITFHGQTFVNMWRKGFRPILRAEKRDGGVYVHLPSDYRHIEGWMIVGGEYDPSREDEYYKEWFKAESKKEAQKRAKKEAPKQKPEKSPAKKPEQKKRSLFGWLKK